MIEKYMRDLAKTCSLIVITYHLPSEFLVSMVSYEQKKIKQAYTSEYK